MLFNFCLLAFVCARVCACVRVCVRVRITLPLGTRAVTEPATEVTCDVAQKDNIRNGNNHNDDDDDAYDCVGVTLTHLSTDQVGTNCSRHLSNGRRRECARR